MTILDNNTSAFIQSHFPNRHQVYIRGRLLFFHHIPRKYLKFGSSLLSHERRYQIGHRLLVAGATHRQLDSIFDSLIHNTQDARTQGYDSLIDQIHKYIRLLQMKSKNFFLSFLLLFGHGLGPTDLVPVGGHSFFPSSHFE